MDRAPPENDDRERLYTNLLQQENSAQWDTLRLKELTGQCAGATDEKFVELGTRARRPGSLKLPNNIYVQLKDSDILSLVEQLSVLMPGTFSPDYVAFFQQDNSTRPNMRKIKYREFSSRLQTLSAVPSSASKIVESLYLCLRNLYEQSYDMTMDVHYNSAYLLRSDVLKQLGKEDAIKREQDLKAIVVNIPEEEDFDEDNAKQLVDFLDIKLTAHRFNSYREIALQWLKEKGSECKLITLVLALMKSHLGRVMSKLLPICSSNPPTIKHYILSLPMESLNGVIAFLGYTQDCVEIRALENACVHARGYLKARMFLRICQFPDCLLDGGKVVQCLKSEVEFSLKMQVVPRSSCSVSGSRSDMTSAVTSVGENVARHYHRHDHTHYHIIHAPPPNHDVNQVASDSSTNQTISRSLHVQWKQQSDDHQSKFVNGPQKFFLQDGTLHNPTAVSEKEQQFEQCSDTFSSLQAVGENKETASTTSLDSQIETDSPRQPLLHEGIAAVKSTQPSDVTAMYSPQTLRANTPASANHSALSADSNFLCTEFDGSRFLYHCMFKEWDMADALLDSAVGPISIEQQQSDEDSGKNAFHYICANENLKRVKAMISKGANLAHVDNDGWSVLHYREVLNNMELLALLLNEFKAKGVRVDLATNQHYTPLLQAINDSGEAAYPAVQCLLKYEASADGNPQAHSRPLTLACELGSLKLVKLLHGFGADLNAQDKDHNTPLLVACKKSRWEVVTFLLGQYGVRVNLSDGSGTTPLFECITKCQYELVEKLLDMGAPTNCSRHVSNPGATGSVEETPLAHACARGLIRYAQLLLGHEADINFRCSGTVSPIGFAIICRKNEMVGFLLLQPTLDKSLEGLTSPIVISVKVENFECTKMILDCLGGAEKALTKARNFRMLDLKEHIEIFMVCYPQSETCVTGQPQVQPPIAFHEPHSVQPSRNGGQLSRSSTSPFRQTGYLSQHYEERARSDDVLRQFCEICMNAIKKKCSFSVLAEVTKEVSVDVSNFFRRCANGTQSYHTIRPDFLGASRNVSPLGFLIGQKEIITCEDFVEQALLYFNGKPEEFYQALIKSFHNIPGGEDLPFDIQSVLNRLFSGQFSLNCSYGVPTDNANDSFQLEQSLRTSAAAMNVPHIPDPMPMAVAQQHSGTSMTRYKKLPIARDPHQNRTLESEPGRSKSMSLPHDAAQSSQGHPLAREQLLLTQSVPASRTMLPSTHTQQKAGLNRQASVPARPPPRYGDDEVKSKPSGIKPQPPFLSQHSSDHHALSSIVESDARDRQRQKAKEKIEPIPVAIVNKIHQVPMFSSEPFKKYASNNNRSIQIEPVVGEETTSDSISGSSIRSYEANPMFVQSESQAVVGEINTTVSTHQNSRPENIALLPNTTHDLETQSIDGSTQSGGSTPTCTEGSQFEGTDASTETPQSYIDSDSDTDSLVAESYTSDTGNVDTHTSLDVHVGTTHDSERDSTTAHLRAQQQPHEARRGTKSSSKQSKDYGKLRPFLLDVTFRKTLLGKGAYGRVEIVEMNGKQYAAKVLCPSSSEEDREQIQKRYHTEFAVLSNLQHRNIVGYIGIAIKSKHEFPLLVMEMLKVDLHKYLLMEQNQGLPLERKFSILHDIASGLDFLHTRDPVVIHRDLSAKNVLLDSNLVAKIADFGNSRIIKLDPSEKSRTLTDHPGTLVYMAPETLTKGKHYGPSIDIFSFGHLAIFTINQKFPGYLKEPTYQKKRNGPLLGRTEVQRRAECIEKLYKILPKEHGVVRLIKKCLNNDPGLRPTTLDILRSLERAQEQLQRERTQENESTIQ